MSTSPVLQLLSDAERHGWSSTAGISLAELHAIIATSPLEAVYNRRTDPVLSILKPTESRFAHPRSLSATYGVGPQPLHTDGAHQIDPPDFLLLSSETRSAVATYLLPVCVGRHVDGPIGELENGVFIVNNGRSTFLSPAVTAGRVRYDPGCMTPGDSRARHVANYFVERFDRAETFEWSEPGLVLAIDNSAVLHARGNAAEEPNRCLERLALRKRREG